MNKPILNVSNYDHDSETITIRITNFKPEHIAELHALVGPVVSDKPFVPGTAPLGFSYALLSTNQNESVYGPSGFIIRTKD